ncbi:MAG: EI24 domain-containing protein [Saprospiraceae bacterium]|nr:EI24 domain-containing protein [Saprospiraceae bacterium]
MISDVIDGLFSHIRVLGVLGRHGLMKYFILSGIGGLLIGALLIWGIFIYYDDIGAFLSGIWPWESGSAIFDVIADSFSVLMMLLIVFLIYKYLIFILLAPIMSLVSQRIERIERGHVASSGINVVGEIIRGLKLAIRNIFKEVLFTIILLIISVVLPWLAWLTGIMIFVIQAYYAGFGNMDYTLERYYSTTRSIEFVSRNRGFAVGNGIIFLLLLTIPVLGMFIAPFFGAAGATLGTLDRLEGDYL